MEACFFLMRALCLCRAVLPRLSPGKAVPKDRCLLHSVGV
jgi:hypothetical protein